MTRKRKPGRPAGERPVRPRRHLLAWTLVVPIIVAVLLCIPCLGLGYFWDDYPFLTFDGRGDFRKYLLPSPDLTFYRPISQGLYFFLLRLVALGSGLVGHIMNLALLVGAVGLLVAFVSRLAGKRAGLFSGLLFASLGCVPSLVAWVSCDQDLLAIVFVLAALLLRDRGRNLLALLCATAAVFSKEPAIAAFPLLVFWDRILGRPSRRPWVQILGYASAALAWLLVHPGIHVLAGRGFRSGATGYVGIEHPERWGGYMVRYVETLVNIPPARFTTTWWESRVPFGIAALAALCLGLLLLDRTLARHDAARSVPLGRIAGIAALFGVPTLLMPAILIRHWAPYFACIPAVGLAILAGPVLARQRAIVAVLVLGLFLLLGVRYRGLQSREELVWTERLFDQVGGSLNSVRSSFRSMFPRFPRGAEVLISVESTGLRGIRRTLLDWQALQVWYRDPTLRGVDVLERKPGAPSEYLARVTTDLDVIRIDPDQERVTSNNPAAVDITEVGRPLRNYARAVAAGGDIDRAVRLTEWLARMESGWGTAYAHHLSAMFLLYGGRRDEASKILATTPAFPREDALAVVRRLLAEPSESEKLDDTAFEAFGLSSSDPEAIRWIMRDFVHDGALAQAAWYAQRLLRLAPGDPEGLGVIHDAERSGATPRRVAA